MAKALFLLPAGFIITLIGVTMIVLIQVPGIIDWGEGRSADSDPILKDGNRTLQRGFYEFVYDLDQEPDSIRIYDMEGNEIPINISRKEVDEDRYRYGYIKIYKDDQFRFNVSSSQNVYIQKVDYWEKSAPESIDDLSISIGVPFIIIGVIVMLIGLILYLYIASIENGKEEDDTRSHSTASAPSRRSFHRGDMSSRGHHPNKR